jgi:hypothetical protein
MSNPSETKRGAEGKSSASPDDTHSQSRPKARDVDRGPAWEPYCPIEMNNYGHVCWRQSDGARVERKNLPVHRLLAVAEFGADAVADKVVHHKNGIPWDNRPDNIELLDRAEHSRHHRQGNYNIPAEELLLDLRAGRSFLGFRPRPGDYQQCSPHGLSTLENRFGGFREALEAAGIDPETGEMQPMDEWAEHSEYVNL